MKKLNNKSGISLIVLVITIIVMIILAAAIILSLQSSGIIGKANEAKSKTDIANARQVVAMAEAEWKLDEEKIRKDDTSIQSFSDYVNKKLEKAGYEVGIDKDITVSKDGAVNTVYVDSKGKRAIIPEGFVASSATGENIIDGGLVIYEGQEAVTDSNVAVARETRNQFVWIPVEDISKFQVTSTYNGTITAVQGQSFDFEEPTGEVTIDWDSNRDPITTTLSLSNDLTGEWKEHYELTESVKQNKGFYIGRYEAGSNSARTSGASNGTKDVLIQKNKHVYNFVGWGPSATNVTGDIIIGTNNQGKGAVELSRNLYKSSKSVSSTLCYGVQWDSALQFIYKTDSAYPTDKSGRGHFCYDFTFQQITDKVAPILTGSIEDYSICNIYDMAGNIAEWTMQSHRIGFRTPRGGTYVAFGLAAEYRSESFPSHNYVDTSTGFRPALYLK